MNAGLERFVQARHGVFERALEGLRAGRKRTHRMWFVFPQLRGLGHGTQSAFYGRTTESEPAHGFSPISRRCGAA